MQKKLVSRLLLLGVSFFLLACDSSYEDESLRDFTEHFEEVRATYEKPVKDLLQDIAATTDGYTQYAEKGTFTTAAAEGLKLVTSIDENEESADKMNALMFVAEPELERYPKGKRIVSWNQEKLYLFEDGADKFQPENSDFGRNQSLNYIKPVLTQIGSNIEYFVFFSKPEIMAPVLFGDQFKPGSVVIQMLIYKRGNKEPIAGELITVENSEKLNYTYHNARTLQTKQYKALYEDLERELFFKVIDVMKKSFGASLKLTDRLHFPYREEG